MKTLFLLGAITIGGFAVNAQDALLSENGILHNQVNEISVVADDFKEISVSEVPQAVTNAISTKKTSKKINSIVQLPTIL